MSAAKYRKRPVVIEAFQMTRERMDINAEWPEWLNEAWQKHPLADGAMYRPVGWSEPALKINTREGGHNVTPGDFIIRGVKGELYPCKPDIFALTYEPVEEAK